MTDFGTSIIHLQPDGSVTYDHLVITDDDRNLESGETGTTWALNGVALATPPAVFFGQVDVTFENGTLTSITGLHFEIAGVDYFIPSVISPERIVGASNPVDNALVGGIAYTSTQMPLDPGSSLTSQALVLVNHAGIPAFLEENTVTLYDDDPTLELTGETGGTPVALLGLSSNNADFNTGIELVRVAFASAGGPGTFEALRITIGNPAFEERTYYIPRTGSVDVSLITAITGETLLASPDGSDWSDFGFALNRVSPAMSGGADLFDGDITNERILGLAGNDTLYGGLGEDSVDGGLGNDRIAGGLHDDVLNGADGADTADGGLGDDAVSGGAGRDSLTGYFGNDRVFGDDGNDILRGDGGNDSLNGGRGADQLFGGGGADRIVDGQGVDTLTGGGGADVFVLSSDGQTDRIRDFADGLDHISLGVAFASLTISTVSPGQVRILGGGETLVVEDSAGLLTAANFTAADFF